MIGFILKKILGTQNERYISKLQPIVDEINSLEETVKGLSDKELAGKTDEFRSRLDKGETLDDILPEAFAVVRETAKRTLGMRHFDVQLIGGIILHRGAIAEMATGEGKTLVATLPAYLNALSGAGVHVITVNDYLARRDSSWMSPVFNFLGLTVGVIQHDSKRDERRQGYACDITYGTNNEFGFDYLRDNMVIRAEDIVQKELNYAIVDEVDSILIDEARTPLIISGVVERSNQSFSQLKKPVEAVVNRQRKVISNIFNEAVAAFKNDSEDRDAYYKLLQVEAGDPKNPRLLDFIAKNPAVKKNMNKLLGELTINKEALNLREGLFYATNERERNVELTDLGISQLEQSLGNIFTLDEDFLYKMEDKTRKGKNAEGSEDEDQSEQEDDYDEEYFDKSEKQHVVLQLLKAFVLFERDTDYVVQPDGEVVIVDEFTGRLMPGRRWSDGLHQAVEAKEGVKVERASQTLATITFQNYFRMYNKLSGMTGTAATEASEFNHIYKLDTIVIPTNKPLARQNLDDVIYKTEKEKFNAVCDEIEALHKQGRPVLVGTVSIERSERLGRLLAQRGIEHQVLNAKYHEREAHIVAQAGRFGAVTIATNMAGRGTDILLGGNPESLTDDIVTQKSESGYEVTPEEREDIFRQMQAKTKQAHEQVISLGGLHVIGTERHESRRIDNQLRGRSGRQGDPGSSKFYLSLEDDLMRIFGSDRIASIMERLGIEEGQEIENPLVTRAIGTAQKRVEGYNFEIRKHLLDYDDVMNKQREVIYERRRQVFDDEHLDEYIREIIEGVVESGIERFINPALNKEDWNIKGLLHWFRFEFGIVINSLCGTDLTGTIEREQLRGLDTEEIREETLKKTVDAYEYKKRNIGPDRMAELAKFVFLQNIDDAWKDHLYALDSLREGIGLRAIGQRDPLVEYKNEAFGLFVDMLERVDAKSVSMLFRVQAFSGQAEDKLEEDNSSMKFMHPETGGFKPAGQPSPAVSPAQSEPLRRTADKVGRNEPCPCGSGKKYKKCCGS